MGGFKADAGRAVYADTGASESSDCHADERAYQVGDGSRERRHGELPQGRSQR